MAYKSITMILEKYGPLLSNELIDKLTAEESIPQPTARTRMRRAVEKEIISVSPASFKHNRRLYFLKDQNIKSKVISIMTAIDSPESIVFNALSTQGGFLYWSEFCKLTACSVEESDSKKTIQTVLDNLINLNVITVVNEHDESNRYIAFTKEYLKTSFSGRSLKLRKKKLELNSTLLEDLMTWLERISIVGWNTSEISKHNLSKTYNKYPFDAFGYTYILGLYRPHQTEKLYNPSYDKAGSPVLVDCISHRATEIFDITSFIKRIENVYGPIDQSRNPNFKILPIFFVSFITQEARELAKQKGIIIIPLSEVFDQNITEILNSTLTLSTENLDIESLEDLLEQMNPTSAAKEEKESDHTVKIQGKLNNLQGIIFNFIIAYIFFKLQYNSLDIGTEYEATNGNLNGHKCECDLTVKTSRRNIEFIVEVKGYPKEKLIKLGEDSTEPDSVKKFFEHTHRIVQSTRDKNDLFYIPIFFTSSSFEPEAIEYMEKRLGRAMKQKIDSINSNFPDKLYYDRSDLVRLSKDIDSGKEIRNILNTYFN